MLMRHRMTLLLATVVSLVVVLVAAISYIYITLFTVHPPSYPTAEKSVWLKQNWQPAQRVWFHHADQGTLTFGIPYEWFIALEQPTDLGRGPG